MNTIKDACRALAQNLIWWQIEPDYSQIDQDLDEFNSMTEQFYEIALKSFYKVENHSDGESILCDAIYYINGAIACPPLRGQYLWFNYSLDTLLELCNPNVCLTKKELKFLNYIQDGLNTYRKNEIFE